MANDFTHDPVKLRIVNLQTGELKQTYVFVGFVPKDVEKELQKIEKNPSLMSSIVLKKFYGPGWRSILGLASLTKHGGKSDNDTVQFEIDDDLLLDLDDMKANDVSDSNVSDNNVSDSIGDSIDDSDNNVSDNNVNDNNINANSSPVDLIELDELIEAKEPQIDVLADQVTTLKVVYKGGVKFITDLDVNPVDNILEFKLKIYALVGIPIYRQHLWIKYKARSYPLNYTISLHRHIETINIERLIEFYKDKNAAKEYGIEELEDIPVEIKYYNEKDSLHVTSQDSFELMRNIYYKYSTNEYFLVDLDDIIDRTALYNKIGKDTYQMELLYYGFILLYFPMLTYQVFQEYIKNEKTLSESYPDLLPTKSSLLKRLTVEGDITSEAYEVSNDKKLESKIFSSITATTLSIDNYRQDIEIVLSLRNLFDVIELSNLITYCKANILHENQNIILRKSYMNEREPRDIIPINSLLIKIKTNTETNENIRLVVFKNGNYVVNTDWREENHMDFKKITKVVADKVNPIIAMINKYDDKVKFHKVDLMELTNKNVIFTETSLVFYLDDDATDARYEMFKRVLEDFRKIGMIIPKENSNFGLEYFFRKGFYKYDSSRIEKVITTSNYYEYLSNGIVKQKWDSVFIRTRLMQVSNVSSKIKISISGIRDDIELENFHMYLKVMFNIYLRSAAHIKVLASETMKTKTDKALKNLKSQDPLLYDFKKIYKSNVIYSKICQKPYQPVILSDEEYSKLSKDRKEKALRFWNFTKEKPVWYSCPNPKYPYAKFITKVHPKDYCIPCCKIMQMNENVNVKKQEIHNTCLTTHMYTGEKVNLTKGSHYIASYGKNIEPGRISRLPEHTLEPLFFDTYSAEGGIDQECVTADGYYLFGVEQHTPVMQDIGMLHVLAHALGSNPKDFLADVTSRVKKQPDKFRVLLDGNAGIYFFDVKSMCDKLGNLASCDVLDPENYENIPWNNLLVSIAYYYFGVNVIIFDDQTKEVVDLILPKGLKNYEEMFPETHKNLVVMRKKTKYYPIYLFNTEIFKRTGIIDNKLFLNASGLITIIKSIVKRNFEMRNIEKIKSSVDLVAMKEFCQEYSLPILYYYINYSNLCYAVVVQYKKNKLYFPITTSHYSLEKEVKLIFTPYVGEYNVDYVEMHAFIRTFQQWNKKKSEKMGLEGLYLYMPIEVEHWITIKGEKNVVAFSCNNVNYFISSISVKEATRLVQKPIQVLFYHPFKINSLIYSVKQGQKKIGHLQQYSTKLNQSLYDFYLYNLVVIHFIDYFNQQRNRAFRAKLVAVLAKTNFDKSLANLREFINKIEDPDDVRKIKDIISRYASQHHDKKKMFDDIADAYFNFDKISLEQLKNKSKKEISKELYKIASSFVRLGKPKITKFPNIFATCGKGASPEYCAGSKLVIERDRLEEIIDILAGEMTDPQRWKWLFNSVFATKTVDFFRFIRRKNETITIEFA